jgi:hypothetical protein
MFGVSQQGRRLSMTTPRLATERELCKLLDRRQYAPTDRRGGSGIMGGDPFNNP